MPTVTVANPTGGPSGAVIAGGQSVHFGNAISWLLAILFFIAGVWLLASTGSIVYVIVGIILALLSLASIQVAKAWEKAIVLRLGRFHRLAGPGIFFIIPAFDAVASWIDQRVQTSTFVAEQTLTKDTVP